MPYVSGLLHQTAALQLVKQPWLPWILWFDLCTSYRWQVRPCQTPLKELSQFQVSQQVLEDRCSVLNHVFAWRLLIINESALYCPIGQINFGLLPMWQYIKILCVCLSKYTIAKTVIVRNGCQQ